MLKCFWLGLPLVQEGKRFIKLETRKATALLAYLSLTQMGGAREFLATMFWPDYDQPHAMANLRRALSSLMADLPGGTLEADRETIRCKDSTDRWVDVNEFHWAVKKVHSHCADELCEACLETLKQAASLYRGEFLESLNLKDSPEFDEWQIRQRLEHQRVLGDILGLLAANYARRNRVDEAIGYVRRWITLDRFHEPAQRSLLRLLIQSGQRNEARREYDEFSLLLNEQLGQAPDEETQALYRQIEDQEKSRQSAISALPHPAVSFPLLKTKLHIPSVPTRRVRRPQLVEQMDRVQEKALTVISAPAGFGKTTLLAEWIAHTPLPIAWLSLDNGDNDPYRFLAYLVSALEGIQEDIGMEARQLIHAVQPVPAHIILASLINELGVVSEPYALILDDYQFITAQPIHEILRYFLDHLPINMHLVISTRSDPPLQLARLRASDKILEIRTQDLRFTAKEAVTFLNDVMGLSLSKIDIKALEVRTEGWIVGLKMAALSLGGRTDTSEFIRTVSGSDRYILDYLSEEVLNHQMEDTRRFLLETSILERLSGPLCDAITNRTGSQALLEEFERNNFFIIPLDEDRQWYRYHQLFSDLLKVRLYQENPLLVNDLYHRATLWLEQNQLLPEAIYYALVAKDYEQFSRLVELGAPAVWTGGGRATLSSWINSIPQEFINKRPWLCVWQALLLSVSGQSSQAELLLQIAEEKLKEGSAAQDQQNIQGHIANIRGNIALVAGDLKQAFGQAEKALEHLSLKDNVTRIRAYIVLFHANYWTGNIMKADDILSIAIGLAREIDDPYWILILFSYRVRLLRTKGQLREAIKTCQVALDLANSKMNVYQAISNINVSYADLLMDTHQLQEASHQVQIGLEISRGWTNLVAIMFCNLGLIRLKMCEGDLNDAKVALFQTEQSIHNNEIDYELLALLSSIKIRLWLREGRTTAAADWLINQSYKNLDQMIIPLEIQQISRARVMLAIGMFSEAEVLLAVLEKESESGGRFSRLIEILVLETLNFNAQGKKEDAFSVLEKSLVLAEPEEYMSVFLDEGKILKPLIEDVLVQLKNRPSFLGSSKLIAFGSRLLIEISGYPSEEGIRK